MKNPNIPDGLIGDSLDELGVTVAQAAKMIGVLRQQLQNIIVGADLDANADRL